MLKQIYDLANSMSYDDFIKATPSDTNFNRLKYLYVIDFIATKNGTTTNCVLSKTRKRNIVESRHMCMYHLVEIEGLTLHDTGIMFNKDHSTVSHAIKTINNIHSLKEKYLSIIEKLNSKQV